METHFDDVKDTVPVLPHKQFLQHTEFGGLHVSKYKKNWTQSNMSSMVYYYYSITMYSQVSMKKRKYIFKSSMKEIYMNTVTRETNLGWGMWHK